MKPDMKKSQQVKNDKAGTRPDPRRKAVPETAASKVVDEELVAMLRERADAGGVKLAGEGGLLAELTRRVLEAAFEGEMVDHLGYGKHASEGRDGENSRNGYRTGPMPMRPPHPRPGRLAS